MRRTASFLCFSRAVILNRFHHCAFGILRRLFRYFRRPWLRHPERSRGISTQGRNQERRNEILRLRCAAFSGSRALPRPAWMRVRFAFANRARPKRSARFCPCKQAKTARFFTMTEGSALLHDDRGARSVFGPARRPKKKFVSTNR